MATREFRIVLPVLVAAALATGASACKKPREPASPAELKEKMSTPVRFGLWKVDATDEQKQRFDVLLDALSVDLYGFQQDQKALLRRTMDALDAPSVDPAALDRLSSAATALFDRYVRRMARASVDASAILTVEQRHKVVGLWREWEFGE